MGEVTKAQTQTPSLKTMVSSESVKKRFNEILGKKSAAFVSSLISVSNNNELLSKADPTTVITAGVMAATLDLPINQNLGFAYIVPFYNSKKKINVGLDIINALTSYYKVNAPVFIDNAEAVTEFVPVNSQTIKLIVDESAPQLVVKEV